MVLDWEELDCDEAVLASVEALVSLALEDMVSDILLAMLEACDSAAIAGAANAATKAIASVSLAILLRSRGVCQ